MCEGRQPARIGAVQQWKQRTELEAVTKQRISEDVEYLVRAIVNCKECELAIVL
jgi:hypothetical protein